MPTYNDFHVGRARWQMALEVQTLHDRNMSSGPETFLALNAQTLLMRRSAASQTNGEDIQALLLA
ncbi:MAG: hypothetical protein L6R36_006361 [Xanthoria steineri]|nr:MAG: hypothetical protein L6R36_006361 [Xanthoria steineri]